MKADCARCREKDCYEGKDCYGIADEVRGLYDEHDKQVMRNAGRIEAEHYMKLTRLEEVMLFADMMGYKRLGMAFCVGLSDEAEVIARILEGRGFEVHSVCCKICGVDKDELGVVKLHDPGAREAVCNPVGQATMLGKAGTEMNLAVGLCVGHDMLFVKHSKAPVTTLIVKDRVLSHNPAGAIYSSYYKVKRFGLPKD